MGGYSSIPISERTEADVQGLQGLVSILRAAVPQVMQTSSLPGFSIALHRRGKPVWAAGFGYADLAQKRFVTPETVFRGGSVTKVYTAIAVMQLVDRGVFDLDTAISGLIGLDIINPQSPTVSITVRHLLTHTSGLGSDVSGCTFGAGDKFENLISARLSSKAELGKGSPFEQVWVGPVGAQRRYSNLGILILGLLIERCNPEGVTYTDFVNQSVIGALGMKWSRIAYPYTAAAGGYVGGGDLAQPYAPAGKLVLASPDLVIGCVPAGACYLVPSEHAALMDVMADGLSGSDTAILKSSTVREMLRSQTALALNVNGNEIPGELAGLGWWLRQGPAGLDIFHHAGAHMFAGRMHGLHWVKSGTTLVMATNGLSFVQSSPAFQFIETIVDNWIREFLPNRTLETLSTEDVPDLSYLLGALTAESYHSILAVPDALTDGDIRNLLERSVNLQNDGVFETQLDASSFLAGYLTYCESRGPNETARIAQSEMRLSLERARDLYARINSGQRGGLASLSGLLLSTN